MARSPGGPGAANRASCSQGTCPNCASLVRQDGAIDTVRTWFDRDAMERTIRALLVR
jgi:hypothetical protein